MPAVLTIRPVIASNARLPVACQITLRLDDRLVGIADCPPGGQAQFTGLQSNRVYAATVRADQFQVSSQLVTPGEADRPPVHPVLCLVSARHGMPLFPDFDDLESPLREVLQRSDALDAPDAFEALSSRLTARRSIEPERDRAARETPVRAIGDFQEGRRRWQALSEEQKAGLLNLFAKMRSVRLLGGSIVWSHVETIVRVERDRIFAIVPSTLRTKVLQMTEPFFEPAGDLLHSPPKGFVRAKSAKTREPFGNLQLTFASPENDNASMLVDADVDDAAGIQHGEQVIRHWIGSGVRKILGGHVSNLPEEKTHPYDIHQILLFYQRGGESPVGRIDKFEPCYSLSLRGGTTSLLL